MNPSMSILEIFSYRDALAELLITGEGLGLDNYQKVFREWQRWENLSRVLKTQFYGQSYKIKIDKQTINKINFKYLNR